MFTRPSAAVLAARGAVLPDWTRSPAQSGTQSGARLGGKSGPIWQHWRGAYPVPPTHAFISCLWGPRAARAAPASRCTRRRKQAIEITRACCRYLRADELNARAESWDLKCTFQRRHTVSCSSPRRSTRDLACTTPTAGIKFIISVALPNYIMSY